MLEKAAVEVARAMRRSLNGSRLIHYVDLPEKWRNNRFVARGYRYVLWTLSFRPSSSRLDTRRFIPLQQWPLIILSIFALHNETGTSPRSFLPFTNTHFNTVNIHTHLIPFLFWSLNLIPLNPFSASTRIDSELPELAFTAFALLCLFTSALWHTMAGCADPHGMELCARVDYVGIGWSGSSVHCVAKRI